MMSWCGREWREKVITVRRRQFGQICVGPRQVAVAGHQPAHRIAGQVQIADALGAQEIGLEDQVELPPRQLLGQIQRRVRGQFQLDGRIGLVRPRRSAGPASCGSPYPSPRCAGGPPGSGHGPGPRAARAGCQHPFGVAQYPMALGGQAHAAESRRNSCTPSSLSSTAMRLEMAAWVVDSFSAVQAETAQAGDPDEGIEKAQIHGTSTRQPRHFTPTGELVCPAFPYRRRTVLFAGRQLRRRRKMPAGVMPSDV